MKCHFAPAGGGPEEVYKGKVNKIGIDIGVTEKSHITWIVFAPGKTNPGALAGVYVGATADAIRDSRCIWVAAASPTA